MTELHVRAIIAGIFFGLWPLFMNRSGVNGNVAAVMFSFGVFLLILPFAMHSGGSSLANAKWMMVVAAIFFGSLGLLNLNNVLERTTPQNVSSFFLLALISQMTVPAIYQVIVTGNLTPSRGIGFLAAIIAAILLA